MLVGSISSRFRSPAGSQNDWKSSLRAGSHFDISISISRHMQKQYDADN